VPHTNKAGITFASDEEFNKIHKKTNNQLLAMGYKVDADVHQK
jgi:hypothetical protein